MKFLSVLLIKFYRKCISPLSIPKCRYLPSCSAYMLEAILKRGFIVGLCLGIWRLLRCNPFSKGGFDPVPDKKSVLKWIY